jgi:hypothetical protein
VACDNPRVPLCARIEIEKTDAAEARAAMINCLSNSWNGNAK